MEDAVFGFAAPQESSAIDGITAFVGGLNIGAENVLALRPKSPVRDLHFQVEGTIVQQIEQEFDDDWTFTTGETPTEISSPPEGTSAPPPADRFPGRTRRSISWFSSYLPRSTRRGAPSGSRRPISCRTNNC